MGERPDRSAQPRAQGPAARAHALSCVLGKLERAARARCRAQNIADLILKVRTGGYLLEMANPRHEHEWRVWEHVKLPKGRKLIPGVISHQTNVVEHPELVAERLVRLVKLVGRDNVIAGTDCGFAQGPFVQRVHPSIMWAKLRALVEGARLASKTLWPRRAAA
jgi:5-methyltetrahydropteroyltriglutamate--homocysteine methyltransferase